MKNFPDRAESPSSPEYVPIAGRVGILLGRSLRYFANSADSLGEVQTPEYVERSNIAFAYNDLLMIIREDVHDYVLNDRQWAFVRHAVEDRCTGSASENSLILMEVANFISINAKTDTLNMETGSSVPKTQREMRKKMGL